MIQKPIFITFEGGEGSGKSTQSKLLCDWLKMQGLEVVLTREPGGTETAEKIREILLSKQITLEITSQLLLHFVSRIEHVHDVIKPALLQNKIVICDRFIDSTIAYQHYGHGISADFIRLLHKELLANIMPDLTFILDIDFNLYKQRMQKKLAYQDRYEMLPDSFHQKVLEGFRRIAIDSAERCRIIPSSKLIHDTKSRIITEISRYLK